jgi:acyl carrier protein
MKRRQILARQSSVFATTMLLLGCATDRPSEAAPATNSSAQRPTDDASTDASVPERLRSIIARTLKIDENKVTAAASFVKDLGADELALVELVMAYERELDRHQGFGRGSISTSRDVIAYLRKRGVL